MAAYTTVCEATYIQRRTPYQWSYRSKCLLLADDHIMCHLCQDCRLKEVASKFVPLTTSQAFGTFRQSILDMNFNLKRNNIISFLSLVRFQGCTTLIVAYFSHSFFIDEWSLCRGCFHAISNLHLLVHRFSKLGCKLIINFVLH